MNYGCWFRITFLLSTIDFKNCYSLPDISTFFVTGSSMVLISIRWIIRFIDFFGNFDLIFWISFTLLLPDFGFQFPAEVLAFGLCSILLCTFWWQKVPKTTPAYFCGTYFDDPLTIASAEFYKATMLLSKPVSDRITDLYWTKLLPAPAV